LAVLLLCFETLLSLAIVQRVAYTEIDWRAYMQQVEGVASGERNYLSLRGDTGPLVYPAGFVWTYQLLWAATSGGADIRLAQHVFVAIYVATQAVVFAAYYRARDRVSPSVLVPLVLSRRLHSIYVLRLFNDTMAMLFAYLAIYTMLGACGTRGASKRRWLVSSVLWSLGVSVKMNVQLMLPGAAYIWWRSGGVALVLMQLTAIAAVQIAIALPFLAKFPKEYLARAFDFGRQFDFEWTVNWRFLGEDAFLSPQWSLFLLVAHLALLAALALFVWPRLSQSTAWGVIKSGFVSKTAPNSSTPPVTSSEALAVVFTANFVGIVCARSLHYQFYAWYAHMLPLLLHLSRIPFLAQLAVWVMIEYSWNIYPSTTFSSLTLLCAHLTLL
ncbi:glycosyltransferase family 58 protein, partial [Coemansia spiralis]